MQLLVMCYDNKMVQSPGFLSLESPSCGQPKKIEEKQRRNKREIEKKQRRNREEIEEKQRSNRGEINEKQRRNRGEIEK